MGRLARTAFIAVILCILAPSILDGSMMNQVRPFLPAYISALLPDPVSVDVSQKESFLRLVSRSIEGDQIASGTLVEVQLTLTKLHTGDAVWDSLYSTSPLRFAVGKGEVIPCVEFCVQQVLLSKKGDGQEEGRAVCESSFHHCFGQRGFHVWNVEPFTDMRVAVVVSPIKER